MVENLRSDEGDWRCPGARGAAQLGMGEDQGELADPVGGQFGGVEALDHEHAVLHVEGLRHLERARRILRRYGAVAPGIAASERDAALAQPRGERAPRPWLA